MCIGLRIDTEMKKKHMLRYLQLPKGYEVISDPDG